MEIKSEKSIKEYLKTLSDDVIIKYYLDVEYSPFPILVIEEYTRRFKQKTKDEIIKSIKVQAQYARKKTRELGHMAKKQKLLDDVTKQKTKEILQQAKKKGYTVSEKIIEQSSSLGSKLKSGTKLGVQSGIKAGQKLKKSPEDKLALLEKLGELQKAGLLTKKEFQEKKKQLLSEI